FAGQEIATTSAKSLRLPTLDEVLRQFSERAFLDIELKVTDGGSHVVAALRAHPPQKGYVVSSFLPHALCAVHNFNESIPLGFLREGKYEPCPAEPHDKPTLPAAWVIPHRSLVDQESIRQAHSAGSKVMVWTVDRGDEMQQLSDWGADAIISDDTALLAATFQ
ncbi:MAG: glycerophosphodiester phosphodiesterase, partial [Terriglobales bacterium]